MRVVASLRMMALGFGPHSASRRLSSADSASRAASVGSAAMMRRSAAMCRSRRSSTMRWRSRDELPALNFKRVVDHREIALVVQESFVGIHFGVDANPEIHVLLDALGARNGFAARPAVGAASSTSSATMATRALRHRFYYCRAHLHSLAGSQSIVFKGICRRDAPRLMSRTTALHASKILTGGAPAPT